MQEAILRQQIEHACMAGTALNIVGGNSKAWYGREITGETLNVGEYTGITSYQPTELVITAKAGTKLSDITSALDEHKQRLPFDPPCFGETATLGGTVACGFSGPRRPYAGSCRDFVLGCRMINGKGEVGSFGGEVMKNVAGFDISRLMTGSLGTLGLMLEISLKVLPHRQSEQTVMLEGDFSDAIHAMNHWAGSTLPVTAMAADGSQIYFRICGTASSVEKSVKQIGGHLYDDGLQLWKDIREHQLPFFDDERPLWRISVPSDAPFQIMEDMHEHDWFIGWGGAQRWLKSELPAELIFAAAKHAGGHATLFRGGDRAGERFSPLSEGEMRLHKSLKQAFDPEGILNPGRMYRDL
ncbi:glycolate oxidase FAD binding subunit [Mariprofundus micogutta]|uniref:Glycolate oxidase FAD binding subunit n=1 Tax=Mariprofundus micogutta TaxID=1921010 RepID=A0A1L8CN57_9PROT|nr:glycolate oxidase subunit GlcE [Mariprofundus micogutta]GAV20348.1 glycolate oxidase FAD binding subunit [Mariprofundus micogutta]